jgi:hypothetical protein
LSRGGSSDRWKEDEAEDWFGGGFSLSEGVLDREEGLASWLTDPALLKAIETQRRWVISRRRRDGEKRAYSVLKVQLRHGSTKKQRWSDESCLQTDMNDLEIGIGLR